MQSIISTGDQATFFIGHYQSLASAYQDPGRLFAQLHLDQFAGRADVIQSIDHFVTTKESGMVVVEAGAGMGKTTLLAWLVKARSWYHHFPALFAGRRDPATAIRNLAAQLIRAWDLGPMTVSALPETASDPYYLHQLLFKCAEIRDSTNPGERIVLVVDALDELDAPAGMNPAGLPEVLPNRVYVVGAQRPNSRLLIIRPLDSIELDARSEANANDMRRFLDEHGVKRPGVASALARSNVAAGDFVQSLLRQSQGVWVYVQSVLDELDNDGGDLDLTTLPAGLWDYYAREWKRWEVASGEDWQRLVLPVLTTLGASREPLTPTLLAQFCGVAEADVASLLGGAREPDVGVYPFLAVRDGAYSFHHASWADFLQGTNAETQGHGNRVFADKMASLARATHGRIADRYLDAWGGLGAGLPGLQDPSRAGLDAGYGLRNVVVHLFAAGRSADVHELLWLTQRRDGRPVSVWRDAQQQYGSLDWYLSDIALGMADTQRTSSADEGTPTWDLLVGYSLLASGVRSMAGNIPPGLLRHQVDRGALTTDRALAYARAIPDPRSRFASLLALRGAPLAPPDPVLLREALTAAASFDDEQLRAGAVALVAPLQTEAALGDLLDVSESIKDPFWHQAATEAATVLVGSGSSTRSIQGDPGDESWHDRRLALTHAISAGQILDSEEREAARRLAAIAPIEPARGSAESAPSLTHIPSIRWRATALSALVPSAGPMADDLSNTAWQTATSIDDGPGMDRVLAAAAVLLDATPGGHDLARHTVDNIDDPVERALALVQLAARRPDGADALRESLRGCLAALPGVDQQAAVLAQWHATGAMPTDEPLLDDLHSVYWRAWIATSGEPSGDSAERAEVDRVVRESLGALSNELATADLLARWAPFIAADRLDEAMTRARQLHDREPRIHALSHLLCARGRLGDWRAAMAESSAIDDPYWRDWCRYQLCLHAPTADSQIAVEVAQGLLFSHRRAAATLAIAERRGPTEATAVIEELRTLASRDEASVADLLHAARQADRSRQPQLLTTARHRAEDLTELPARRRAKAQCADTFATLGWGEEALSLALTIDDEFWQATALVAAMPALGLDELSDAFVAARALVNQSARGRVLVALSRRIGDLAPEHRSRALAELLTSFANLPRRHLLEALPTLLSAFENDSRSLSGCADRISTLRGWTW